MILPTPLFWSLKRENKNVQPNFVYSTGILLRKGRNNLDKKKMLGFSNMTSGATNNVCILMLCLTPPKMACF